MSKPRPPAAAPAPLTFAPGAPERADLPVGESLIEVLDLAYRARRPVLLEGPTGIGKSQVVAQFAAAAGLEYIALDLSLLEPPDLVGLPVIRDGRTHYASPAELPTGGRGVLMLEELNRAETPVMQPALQLLSARRLHTYELPPGWVCFAAVNPDDGTYEVNRLDPALRARFLQVTVGVDREAWLRWATRSNVHPVVTQLVRDNPDVFESASPRSWAYVSDVLAVLRPDELGRRDLLRVALRGYLPAPWALRVASAVAQCQAPLALDPGALGGPEGAARLAELVASLTAQGRIDAVATVAMRVRTWLAGDEVARAAARGEVTLEQLERLTASLPGDLRAQCLQTAVESPAGGHLLAGLELSPADLIDNLYRDDATRARLRAWGREGLQHRVRLVVVEVVKTLRREHEAPDAPLGGRQRASLGALLEDVGPQGGDLLRWVRARMQPEPRRGGA